MLYDIVIHVHQDPEGEKKRFLFHKQKKQTLLYIVLDLHRWNDSPSVVLVDVGLHRWNDSPSVVLVDVGLLTGYCILL